MKNCSLLFFYFSVLTDIAASILKMSFLICISGFRLKLFRIAVSQKRLQLEAKTDTTTGLFLGFQLESAEFRRFHFCMDWNLLELLNFQSIWRDQKFSIVCGVFCSVVLIKLYFLAVGFCNIGLKRFSIAMQLLFHFLRPPVQLFRKLWWKTFLITHENQVFFYQSFLLTTFETLLGIL